MGHRNRSRIRRSILVILVVLTSWLTLSAGNESRLEQGDPELAERLTKVLSTALDEGGSWDDLRLDLACLDGERFRFLEIFGRGIGILDDEVQFEISLEAMREVLLALRAADFAWMEKSYGGRHDRSPEVPGLTRPAGAAIKVVCRLTVSLGGVEKPVSQLFGGRQHGAFRELADRLFEIAGSLAADGGVRAASLADGLERIAAGDLAPEVFRVLLIRQGDGGVGGDPGWQLRIEGMEASARAYDDQGGLGESSTLTLTATEVVELAEMLSASAAAALPQALHATAYTDLAVEVLAYELEVEARRYRDQESAAQQEDVLRFEGIMAAFDPLRRRLLGAER